ncbi:LptM family lipoprotein [Bartonella sp. F02]|uniref:LptM family lipoprotein n=1 Tax=Bartonella sp. F02 TaxID=2967262 RepID=UPI0022A9F1AA|nr:hypothetical protein [Bartonella sp. F02]MCZ2327885.1 hypothetical protein [Bartonella sp. F02]
MKIIFKRLAIVFFYCFIIAGCGRKGALLPPVSTVVETSHEGLVSKSTADKSFVLDRLIQ